MPEPEFSQDLALLAEAAEASGKIAKRYWQKSPEVTEKSGGAGPVTEADLAIDQMLRSELCGSRPDYGWLSEETEDNPARHDHERVFIVDPIDGTRAFINGAPDFSHSLAIAQNGEIVAAAVFLPIRKEMYLATLSGPATLNGLEISATQRVFDGAEVLGAQANFEPDHWQNNQSPPVVRKFRSSLAWRLCLVGEGRFDAMLTLRPTWEWDVAAGSLIAARAGARVTDLKNATPLFNNRVPKLRGMLAAGAEVHHGLLTRLKSDSVPQDPQLNP